MKKMLLILTILAVPIVPSAQMVDDEKKGWHDSFDKPEKAQQDAETHSGTDTSSIDVDFEREDTDALGKSEADICNTLQECLKAIKYGDDKTKIMAVKRLSVYKGDAVPILINMLNDADVEVKRSAADALGEIGPAAKESISHLARLLDTGHSQVDSSAAAALGKIGPAAISALLEVFRESSSTYRSVHSYSSSAKLNAFKALDEIGPKAKTALPVLIEALKNKGTRDQAAMMLIRLGPAAKDAVPALIKWLRAEPSASPIIVLGSIGPAASGAIPVLESIEKYNKDLREIASEALADIKGTNKAALGSPPSDKSANITTQH